VVKQQYSLRDAGVADGPFLELMLLAAANWLPRRQMTLDQLRAAPDLAHYISGWPRVDDMGVVAVDADERPIGAVWLRLFGDEDPGYGYVSANVPELSIGVRQEWRGRGVGRALMRAQADQAQRRGLWTLSLSVERANPAAELYRSEGWRVTASGRDSDTMILDTASMQSPLTR
jgi:GNAT superfamily N-acetyltransferase